MHKFKSDFIGIGGLISCISCSDSIAFMVVSDPHLTGDSRTYLVNRNGVKDMNHWGDNCSDPDVGDFLPQFVWVLGDLTDAGLEEQWEQYESLYGLNGDKLLKYPVFECFGNHEGNVNGVVRAHIRKRNEQRTENRKWNISTDSVGLHYSWNAGGIHFVNLNLYPVNKWDPACEWCPYFKESFREAEGSLDFLKKDLSEEVGDSNRPVVLAFHVGFDDFSLNWWTEKERNDFYEVIKAYHIVAIFHGHNHQVGKYTWRGIPMWSVGSPRHENKEGEYLMVKITRERKVLVKERNL